MGTQTTVIEGGWQPRVGGTMILFQFFLATIAACISHGRVIESPSSGPRAEAGLVRPMRVTDSLPLDRQLNLKLLEEMVASDPRANLDVPQLLAYYGYGCEIHKVTTDDGYILTLHRILPKNSTVAGTGIPVLLQHGLLSSSSTWIMNYPNKALGYILTELGYDVWMGNARGGNYSIGHTTLDTSSYEFWDFSMNEMGKYDLPAVIDHILIQTHHVKMHYVGHSMGTQMFWILENEHPGYASERIMSMSALGPVAYVGQGSSPLELIAPINRELDWVLRSVMHYYQFFNPNAWITKIFEDACQYGNMSHWICSNTLFLVVGFDSHDLDMSWMPVIMKQLNAGASTRTLVHFGQLMSNDKFQGFDFHGDNEKHYNQKTPPQYDLSMVRVPVLLKWGMNDPLADPTDVARMAQELTSCELRNLPVSDPKFSHLDFVWGIDAYKVVYPDIVQFMKDHEK